MTCLELTWPHFEDYMASDIPLQNPNEEVLNEDLQVMSPRGAHASSIRPMPRTTLPNGIPAPPAVTTLNMDGETISAPGPGSGQSDSGAERLTAAPLETTESGVAASSKATTSAASARGFFLGPLAKASPSGTPDGGNGRAPTSFLTGMAKAVQAIPAAVEGLMMGQGSVVATDEEHQPEMEGFTSAQSGSPDGRRTTPHATHTAGTPLLDETTLQRLNGLQASAPHLYVPEAPSSGIRPPSTTSSDIQAEVRRQVREFMVLRDEENRELRMRVDLLMTENRNLRQEVSSHMYSRSQGARPESSGRFSGLEWIGRGFGNLMSGVSPPKPVSPPEAPVDLRPPPAPPQHSLPQPPRALPPAPIDFAPASDTGEYRQADSFYSQGNGFRPNRPITCPCPSVPEEAPTARVLDFDAAGHSSSHPEIPPQASQQTASEDPMNVVLTGMAQLQGVVADLASSPKQAKQEVIKPGVNSLPDLPAAGPEACLQFADWLHSSKPALSDISDTSEELWSLVLAEAKEWYTRYLKLDAVSRLTSKPVPSAEVTQAKWTRVSRRIETIIIAACPVVVRDEISAARVTGLLQVVARLYVIYAPGGLTEREIGLRQIQDPSPGTTIKDTVDLLRRWHRWCDRMRELGGTLPDSALRVKALERITRVVLQANTDIAFRVNLTRAALQVDTNPDDLKVEQLHAHLLGELEAIIHRSNLKDQDKAKETSQTPAAKVKGVEDPQASPKNPKFGKGSPKTPGTPKAGASGEGQGSGGVPCTFFTGPGGCKKGADCTFVHNWLAIPASERSQRCRTCGGKGHRSADCKAGVKVEEKAKNKASPGNPKVSPNPKGTPTTAQAATVSPPPPPKELSQQQIKSMLADAAQILQQASPNPPQSSVRGYASRADQFSSTSRCHQ